jgi:1-acyl-sn-glycerol-3-phosphate acyltransferase
VTAELEPPRAPGLRAWLASRLLRAFGWTIRLPLPVPDKCVVIWYPHTSNWDFPIGLCSLWATGLEVRWVGKDSLFRTPFSSCFERWGGIPVKRSARGGFIAQMTEAFARHDRFLLFIAPEGTRARTGHWKSGFYYLARAAKVPLGLGFVDYPTRTLGIGAYVTLSGVVADDMAMLAAFYADKRGHRPELAAPVRLDAQDDEGTG